MNVAAVTTPALEQINQTKRAIEHHIQSIDRHPDRREGAYPYYLFHEPGQPIRGTVMMFHGFSAKPHQMWRLADYLFQNGFNVYQSTIAGHVLTNPAKNWCQVDLKPPYADPLREKLRRDPILQDFFKNFATHPDAARPGFIQQIALMARLVALEPRSLDIMNAIESPNNPDFDHYFTSSHLHYLTDAKARLEDLHAMPGAIYTVGLSVGGAVALGLAASRPDRVKGVVAYAPLLRIHGKERRQYVNLAGPLDISESGWDANLRFPVGALTAVDRFGSSVVMSPSAVRSLQTIPTFMVLTENEDAADIDTNKRFFQDISSERNRNAFYLYLLKDQVPHPMVDPTEVSQNMSNHFWQSLYQETFRFLTEGRVNMDNMGSLSQAQDVPPVANAN
ncbi:alpha/beta hydrolase [Myxacorys almedinensis A]|uniref:Alpha/beta hydrolase n=2 Tax=Myxacorys TaxID=2056239 RepID=A0A8J7Z4E0_9CYAN|nr:alpha/beta hydrolase [Myxacorys almedinensis A]